MSKEDRFGILGVIVCAAVAALDAGWRPFWIAGGVFLALWTVVSLWRRSRA